MRPLTTSMFEILVALTAGPLHGYAIAKRIAALHGNGARSMGPATLYSSIGKLMGMGMIEELGASADDPRRKTYKLTATGATAVAQALREQRQFIENATAGAGPEMAAATWAGGAL